MESKNYIPVKDLKVYQMARNLSAIAWNIFSKMSFEDKKHIGDQFIRSTDSIGANIAEGYSRFHFLDKVRFHYIARASQSEATGHWLKYFWNGVKYRKKPLTSTIQFQKTFKSS